MNHRVLDTGRFYGEVAEPWQETRLFRGFRNRKKYAYIELPRGHDKTGAAAWDALYSLLAHGPGQRIYAFAGDRDQARLFLDAIRGYLWRRQELSPGVVVQSNRVMVPERDSVITVESSDVPSSYGIKPTRLYLDELHAWRDEELFASLLSASGKIPRCKVIVTTNCGHDKTSFCYRVRETARQSDHWYFFSAHGWLATWVSADWIESQRQILSEASFRRLILNEWVGGTGQFVHPSLVDACVDPDVHPRRHSSQNRVAIACDLGITRDNTAIAVVEQQDNGSHRLVWMDVFCGSEAEPVNVRDVENTVLSLTRELPQAETLVDPWQMQGFLQDCDDDRVQPFTFSGKTLNELTSNLRWLVNVGRLKWYPDAGRVTAPDQDIDLAEEMKNLVVREMSYGSRIDHGPGHKSDRCMALAMACWHLTLSDRNPKPAAPPLFSLALVSDSTLGR